MPIYEYLCNACGAEKEHLQKISDAPIAACPDCGSSSYVKRISAAGFQLKGSGWYVTDFKNNNAVWLAGITGHSTIILYDESVNNLVYVKALLLTPLQLNFKIKTIDEKLDDYFLKLDEIKSISVNPNSTLDNLKQSIEDYSLFSNDINETLGNTTEMKIIKYQLDRNRKDILHSSLLKTVEIKKASMTEYQQNHTYSETMTFSSSINELSQYCNNIIDSCDCMKNRKEIIEKKGQLC